MVGDGGFTVPGHRASALKELEQPVTKKILRSILGAISYYWRFIPRFVDHFNLLSLATFKKASGVVEVMEDMLSVFISLKGTFCSVCKSTTTVCSNVSSLHTNASEARIGATLSII